MAEAQSSGKGAVSLDGRMIDAASVRQAEVMVAKSRAISKSLRTKARITKAPVKSKSKSKRK